MGRPEPSKLPIEGPGEADRYRLERPLGEGGSASVWLARAGASGPVALKVGRSMELAAALADEALHASLALSPRLPELRDVGMLRVDKRTATVLAPGSHDSQALPFVALRWCEGRSLRAAMAEAPDRVALALSVAHDVGEALSDLHDVGVAHGDVK